MENSLKYYNLNIDYKVSGMDLESKDEKSQRARRNSAMDSESALGRGDFFQEILNMNISDRQEHVGKQLQQAKTQRKYNKRTDIRKILNTSSSNDRLVPSSLKHDSSRENSERSRNNFQTQNSMDQQSISKSFIKRYDQSFSVSNTIRDSSSSISEKSQSKSFNQIFPAQYREEQGIMETEEEKNACYCKKSKCLKLYCQCFQRQLYCNENCKCYDCGNTNQNMQKHKKAVISALARNARGFQDQKKREDKKDSHQGFSLGVEIQEVKKGCKCRKTHCIKKYCQCFHSEMFCGIFCRCENCFNTQKYQNQSQNEV